MDATGATQIASDRTPALDAASARQAAVPGQTNGLTFRSIFVGAVLMVFFSLTLPYNDYKLFATFMTGNLLPIALVLVLAILALAANPLWRAGLLAGEEFLVCMWGAGVYLVGLVAEQEELLDVLPLASGLAVTAVAARALSARWKEPAPFLAALGRSGCALLALAALDRLLRLGEALGVLWDALRLARTPEVAPGLFAPTPARMLAAALLGSTAVLVLVCAGLAAERVRAGSRLSFDPARATLAGVYVAFGAYAVGRLAFDAPTGMSSGVGAFLAILALVCAGVALRMLRSTRLAALAGELLRSTRGRPLAATLAGLAALRFSGSPARAALAAAAGALAVEAAIRLRKPREARTWRDSAAFALAAAAATALIAPLAVASTSFRWVIAAAGLAGLGFLGMADATVVGALDWLAVAGAGAGFAAWAATGSAAAGALAGGACAFGVFSVAGSTSLAASARRPFSKGELITIFLLMLAGSGVPSSSLIRYLHPSMVAPAYYASPENQWETKLLPHIPDFLTPSKRPDDPVVTRFFEGIPREELKRKEISAWEAIPWGRWVGPTLSWLVFVALCYFMMLCLAVLLRRQWEEHERLRFPLVQVPIEMAEEPASGRLLGGFFRSRAMWLGAAVPIVVHGVNGLSRLWPKVPSFELFINIWSLFWGQRHWGSMMYFELQVYFSVIGVMYLLPTEVSLSLWFFFVLLQAELFFGSVLNLTIAGNMLTWTLPWYQSAGCYIAYALFMVWASRHHIGDIFRKVRGPWECRASHLWALGLAAPLVYLLSARAGLSHAEAAAGALVYLLVVPAGKALAALSERSGEGTFGRSLGHLTGIGTVTALGCSLWFGWSALVPLLAALVEARRRARSAPALGRAGVVASFVPTAVMLALLPVPQVTGGAYWFMIAAVAAYTAALPLPALLDSRGRTRPALACRAVAAVLIPAVLGAHVWDVGWAVSVGVSYALLGPAAAFLREFSRGAAELDDSREGMSYRTAVLGLVGAGLATAQIASATTGMSFGLALGALAVILMTLVGLSRLVAQGGIHFVLPWIHPTDIMNAAGGPRLLGLAPLTDWGARSQVMMRWIDDFFVHDMREAVMPTMMNCFRMGTEASRDRRRLLWLIVLSIAIAAGVSSVVRIYLSYANGGLSLGERYSMQWAPNNYFGRAVSTITNPTEFRPGYMVGIGIGAALTAAALAMSARFYWWPIHPIGVLFVPSYALWKFWWSVLLGWLFKTAIWRFGGSQGVRRLRPAFLGLILGDSLIGGFWIVVGLVMGQRILAVMPE